MYSYLRDRSINDIYFRHVANYTYDWESWHDPQGKLIWVNDSVDRMTGYSVRECLEMNDYPLPIIKAKDQQRIVQLMQEAMSGRSYNDVEFEIIHRNGSTRWMAISSQPMFGEKNEHLGFRTSVRDITDRQSLKVQLQRYAEHLEKMVEERTHDIAQLEQHRRQMEKLAAMGELAAGVAHEINNPLAGIRNAFALFRSGLSPQHQHFELLELVDREIERIASIIHQMYQLYRHVPGHADDFVVEKALVEIGTMLEPVAARHQVSLKLSPEQQTHVCLPEGELKQILFNLIRNAIQASRPQQTVSVRISDLSTQVRIDVSDQGTGIPDDILPHIFEPFFTTKGQLREGMGLGLSVSRNLVGAMGGEIVVKTEFGIGSTFTVVVPRRMPDAGQQKGLCGNE